VSQLIYAIVTELRQKRRAGKQRTRYEPTGRRNTEGWRSKLAQKAKNRQAQAAQTAAE